jgi:hypothetical protein
MVSNPPEMAVAHQRGLGHQVSLGDRLLHQATPGPRALAAVLDGQGVDSS